VYTLLHRLTNRTRKMKLNITLADVTPRIDYVSRIGGVALTHEATAVEAAQANNFKIDGREVVDGVLTLTVRHGGDPRACAKWMGDRLQCAVDLVR